MVGFGGGGSSCRLIRLTSVATVKMQRATGQQGINMLTTVVGSGLRLQMRFKPDPARLPIRNPERRR